MTAKPADDMILGEDEAYKALRAQVASQATALAEKDAEIARLKTRVAFGVIGCADCDGALWAEMEACPTCSLREALTIARATVVQYGKLVHPGDLEVDSTLRRIDAALSKVEAK